MLHQTPRMPDHMAGCVCVGNQVTLLWQIDTDRDTCGELSQPKFRRACVSPRPGCMAMVFSVLIVA
jgi:hypothetical protein